MTIEVVQQKITAESITLGFRLNETRQKFWGTTRDGGASWEVRTDRTENGPLEPVAKAALVRWAVLHPAEMRCLREDRQDHADYPEAYDG